MVSEKGFIHVIEAVLVSVLAISMLPYIIQTPGSGSDWEEVRLRKTGNDILVSLEKSDQIQNISTYNQTEIGELFNGILGERTDSIQYNIKERNSYRESIRIGFNCTSCDPDKFKESLLDTFTPVWLNGRPIEFQIFEFDWDDFKGEDTLARQEFDLVLINGSDQMDNVNQTKLEKHISEGGGVIEYAEVENVNSNLQQEIFGLDSTSEGSSDMVFTERNEPRKQNYEPGKIFYGTGSTVIASDEGDQWRGTWTMRGNSYSVNVSLEPCTVDIGSHNGLEEGDNFTTGGYNFTLEKVRSPESGYYENKVLVWIRHKNGYEFNDFSNQGITSLHENGTVLENEDEAGMVVNEANRAAWIAPAPGDDIEGLLQAAAIWATKGEQWQFQRSPGRKSVQASHFTARHGEIYEPYEVVINLWYIY
ncbi:MAG: hypothetical protein ACLFS3_01920 [Candidatus Aenigmatarchaeota archaeon]